MIAGFVYLVGWVAAWCFLLAGGGVVADCLMPKVRVVEKYLETLPDYGNE